MAQIPLTLALQVLIIVALFAALPFAIRRAKRGTKSGAGAVMLTIGALFSGVRDPATGTATEEIDRQRARKKEAGFSEKK